MKTCHGQLNWTENSQTQIWELKKATNLSKQLSLYKSKGIQKRAILFPKDGVKQKKHMLKKINNLKKISLWTYLF